MKKFLLLLLCAGCGAVLAAEDDITFHGTLMSPPACSISGGQTIEVQFRDLIIDSIDGNYGRQKVDYELSCDSDVRDPEWNMTLSWTGTAPPTTTLLLRRMYRASELSFSMTVSVLSSTSRFPLTPPILARSQSWRRYRSKRLMRC